jgi:hypothetical protein
MVRIILSALRARPAQAVAIGVLAALAAGLAAITPAYLAGAVEAGTAGAVEAAPASERVVTVRRAVSADTADSVVTSFAAAVRPSIERTGLQLVPGLLSGGRLAVPVRSDTTDRTIGVDATFAYREGMCNHVRITGACPSGDRDLMVSSGFAANHEIDLGASITYAPGDRPAMQLTVTGIYHDADPGDLYWADGALVRSDPVLVAPGAFRAMGVPQLFATADGMIRPAFFRSVEPGVDANALVADLTSLARGGYTVSALTGSLSDRVLANRRSIVAGVPLAGAQVLLVCWFALGLAVRHSGASTRTDVGLLKLRGVPGSRVTTLAVGRSAVPILAGAAAGTVGALALIVPGKALIGTPHGAPTLTVAASWLPLGAVGAALVAVLGSLVVAVAAERRLLRQQVADLLRKVPKRRVGWRAGAAEIVVLVLAGAAVYEVRSVPADDPLSAGLALFVPLLVALAVALTATRLLLPLAAVAGHRAFGGGRLTTGLAVVEVARRPGARRLAALLVIATALLVTAGVGWAVSVNARSDRANLELGAPRVLTVTADSSAHLLAAVRAADPGGRNAMAAVVGRAAETANTPATLAVDTPRLIAVVAWPPGVVPPAEIAARLRPPVAAAVITAGKAAELDVTVAGPGPVTVNAQFVDRRGAGAGVRFGPVPSGRHTVRVDTPGCADRGCRLVSLTLTGAADGSSVTLHRLSQLDPPATLVDQVGFADLSRWRQPVGSVTPGLLASSGPDGLRLTADEVRPVTPGTTDKAPTNTGETTATESLTLEVADTPLPLPAVGIGRATASGRVGGQLLRLFGGDPAPVRPATASALLPRLGTDGLIVDLEYADRLLLGVAGTQQVWLARDAPATVVDRLGAEGLRIVSSDTLDAAIARYSAQGSAAVLRLYLIVAVAGLLMAAGAVLLVAAVDRPARVAEMAALRLQGIPARAVTRSVVLGYAVVVAVAVLLGVAAAVVARWISGAGLPLFDDRWDLLARPAPGWAATGLLAVGLLGTLVPAVVVAGRLGGGR